MTRAPALYRIVFLLCWRARLHLVLLQYIVSLHTWVLEQLQEVLETANLSGPDANAVKSFTREFAEMARSALAELGHERQVRSLAAREEEALAQ